VVGKQQGFDLPKSARESLADADISEIAYLSGGLNSASAEKPVIEQFWPRPASVAADSSSCRLARSSGA
jgi:hypothetical protein